MRFFFIVLSSLFISLLVVSCKNDDDTKSPEPANPKVVSASLLASKTGNSLKTIATNSGFDTSPLTFSDYKVYKLVYKTTNPYGQSINASGTVILPNSTENLSLLAFHHGTITEQSKVPSAYPNNSFFEVATSIHASALGVVVLSPDYIGYGASSNQEHPYQHRESLAKTSADMIEAAKEFLTSKAISLNGRLYIAGYSEGGFAGMATHKYLEENNQTVTQSFLGAGAYNTTRLADTVVATNGILNYLSTYLWVVETYNEIYNLDLTLGDYLNEPFATTLASVEPMGYIGYFEENYATNPTANNPATLFSENGLSLIGNNVDVRTAFNDNDIYDWTPNAPIALFHGNADTYVPYFNSEDALNSITENGGTITLKTYESLDHIDAASFYHIDVIEGILEAESSI